MLGVLVRLVDVSKYKGVQALSRFIYPTFPQHPLDQRSTDVERLNAIITNSHPRWTTCPYDFYDIHLQSAMSVYAASYATARHGHDSDSIYAHAYTSFYGIAETQLNFPVISLLRCFSPLSPSNPISFWPGQPARLENS